MASDQGKKLLEFRAQNTGPDIKLLTLQIVMMCGCGSKNPIVLLFVPGLPLTAFCPDCKTRFKLARLIYDPKATGNENPEVGIHWEEPQIVAPGDVKLM